ncbi:MAG: hypothetical protein AUG49_23855 [Catenulispora sp. 13_1_20CM_3_70_7]|nr:MAG: hypothetical protein AUG49_23855 [Catenulispora sp. 13_1_20CM_3_70_7]
MRLSPSATDCWNSSSSCARSAAETSRSRFSLEPNRYSSTRGLEPIAAASGRRDRSETLCSAA